MGLLDRLKTALGLDARSGPEDAPAPAERDADVRVEREPDASTEAAVKGTDPGEPAAAGTDAAGSTGSITETPPEAPGADDVGEAAEPAEAAGPVSQVGGPDSDPDADGGGDSGAGSTPETTADDRPVREITGVGPAYERRLNEVGIRTVGGIAAADPADLAERIDVAPGRVENWVERAREP